MRLIALLAFYDEEPQMLVRCVSSLAECCDDLVILDGGYAEFPGARAASPAPQVEAVCDAAERSEFGIRAYVAPDEQWAGNEVEKRNHLFDLGRVVAEPGDWFLIIDADMVVTQVPSNLKQVLSETDLWVGTYWLADPVWGGRHPIRLLFEAADDLHVKTTHYGYRRGDTYLWETGGMAAVETDLVIEHRGHERSAERNARADEYDRRIAELGLETLNPPALAEHRDDGSSSLAQAQP